MATEYSNQYNSAFIAQPSEKLEAAEDGGRIRRKYAKFDASSELSAGDVVKFLRLPSGATLMDCRLISPDWGTTGQADLGWQDADGGSSETDADGIFQDQDMNTAAVDANMGGTMPGFNKEFSKAVDVIMTVDAASTALSGNSVEVEVKYVID